MDLGQRLGVNLEDAMNSTLAFIVGMMVFIGDLLAMSWLGMWAGLNARNANRQSPCSISSRPNAVSAVVSARWRDALLR